MKSKKERKSEERRKETKKDGDEGNEKRIRSLIWFVLVLSLHRETFDLSHNHNNRFQVRSFIFS